MIFLPAPDDLQAAPEDLHVSPNQFHRTESQQPVLRNAAFVAGLVPRNCSDRTSIAEQLQERWRLHIEAIRAVNRWLSKLRSKKFSGRSETTVLDTYHVRESILDSMQKGSLESRGRYCLSNRCFDGVLG